MARASADPEAPPANAAAEVARFEALAAEWWDPAGKFRPLHRINPVRLRFIEDHACRRFARPREAAKPLAGLSILDIGCGGGLLCEPLASLGAEVTGIDPGAATIEAASRHAAATGLDIRYRRAFAEDLVGEDARFDIVLAMEVVEHVPDLGDFLAAACSLVAPGGLLFAATLNRTPKAYLLAIVAAEYVLGWLPRGTHDWQRFVMPEELARHLKSAGFEAPRFSGIVYDVMRDAWRLDPDCSVNYMAAAVRRG